MSGPTFLKHKAGSKKDRYWPGNCGRRVAQKGCRAPSISPWRTTAGSHPVSVTRGPTGSPLEKACVYKSQPHSCGPGAAGRGFSWSSRTVAAARSRPGAEGRGSRLSTAAPHAQRPPASRDQQGWCGHLTPHPRGTRPPLDKGVHRLGEHSFSSHCTVAAQEP